jgi:hypothetical protein
MTEDQARKYLKNWQNAGPALQEIRRSELRKLSDDDVRSQIHDLLDISTLFKQVRVTSGLIEQQQIFQKART